ncbi:MAG TPA: uracil phosphoribosyltransferase [Candidatus Tumulicola sp.]|nr:uracil phosphoribosyltransferase [Candidatus Tumulicola sp.]
MTHAEAGLKSGTPHAFANLTLVEHPLVQDKLGRLRDAATPDKEFRELCTELATLVAFPATADLETTETTVATPLDWCPAQKLTRVPLLVPILRAGLGLVPGFHALMPQAHVAHIGVYRDPDTLEAVPYYLNLPDDLRGRRAFVLDPMLATGASAVAAVNLLVERGAAIEDLRLIALIAAPEGVSRVCAAHPSLKMFSCALDKHLNSHGYIIPGLGDAGDRLFGRGAGRVPQTRAR